MITREEADAAFEPYWDVAPVWRSLSVSDGWLPLLVGLLSDVTKVQPELRIYQVKEKFGCYDEQTEVLTENGWKSFAKLDLGERLATRSEDGILEYQLPERLIAEPYVGEMYRLQTRGVDLLVTPNHRLLVAKGTYWNGRYSPPVKREYPFEFVTPEVMFGRNKRFVKGAAWNASDVDEFILPELVYTNTCRGALRTYRRPAVPITMDDWLVFLGWYLSEGCTSKNRGDICIAFNNTDGGTEYARVSSAISAAGFIPRVYDMSRSAGICRIYNTQLARWLRENCGSVSTEKRVPEFVRELSSRQIRLFLDTLYAGDGYRAKTAFTLSTVSGELADGVQELILKAGGSSRLRIREVRPGTMFGSQLIQGRFPVYEVNWLNDIYHNTSNKGMAPSSYEGWVEYEGMVYCATVPNGTLFIRRNGIPVWCGNSLRFYTTATTDEVRNLITQAERRSAEICEVCGEEGRLGARNAWWSTRCEKDASEGWLPFDPSDEE